MQGDGSATADFSMQVTRLRALGFNAVKLPFSFAALLGATLAPVSTACTTSTAGNIQVSRAV
jgi:NhaP-type Na+/H+ or K+/H+ antiporter